MKKALVTGALGQDGSYLIELLHEKGYDIFGFVRGGVRVIRPSLLKPSALEAVTWLYGDLRDAVSIDTAIRKSQPDEIYNLGAQPFVPTSWTSVSETFDINTGGLARILKAVETIKPDTKVYQASTSEMFGNHYQPCSEVSPMNPTSPYGIAKLAAHNLCRLYRERGLFVVSGILFNHESPRRGAEMVTRKITRAVARWKMGDDTTLLLGNLDACRDWGYAKEYVEAMWLMMQKEHPGDWVVGMGESHSVRDFLAEAIDYAQVHDVAKVEEDPKLKRTGEIHNLVSNPYKVNKYLGWAPRTSFKELVHLMVDADIARLQKGR